MNDSSLDVIVIGAGQAGLSISYFLQRDGVRHLVLERARIGESWRTQRWDSFMLNSPNKLNVLPGDAYTGDDPDGFSAARSFIAYLEGYAHRFGLPVREHSPVMSVERNSRDYHVTALVGGKMKMYGCRQIVVASGAMSEPKAPRFSRAIPAGIRQYHAGEYRSPSELPPGSVLVVGSAQSGLQIAEDLLGGGRRVFLSTSAVGRVPRRYRGRDILDWLLTIGYLDMKTEEVVDPRDLAMRQPQVSGVGRLGHTQSLQFLARKGAVILGKIDSVDGRVLHIQPNAADHIRFSDEVSARVKAMIEQYIAGHKLDAPHPEPDPADEPDTDGICASPLRTLDLVKENITAIIWATGFSGDYAYLKDHPVDGNGLPLHRNGISKATGLFFLGMPWLRKRKSGVILGIEEDAAFIMESLKASQPR